MPIIDSRDTWPVDRQEDRVNKGKLIRVQRRPGQYVKMYEQDAIDQGLIPGKSKPKALNKMLMPQENKAKELMDDQPGAEPSDDFTTIPGLGKATARALAANGITTFDELKAAGRLPFLTDKANAAIEDWRNG